MWLEGAIANQGVITFINDTNTTNDEILNLQNTVTLSGGGELILNSADSRVSQAFGGGALINVDNTIRGLGTISAPVTNQATIRAEGGRLLLSGTVVDGQGEVFVAPSSELEFNGSLFTAATITVDPTGVFDFNGSRLELESTGFQATSCPSFSQFAWLAVSARCRGRPTGRSGV